MKIKFKNLIAGLKGQLPFKRAFRNFFITGNAWGMFSKHSHINKKGNPKQEHPTIESAEKVARLMEKKYLKNNITVHFSVYKCVFCDGWHIGKNRDSKKLN